MTEDDSDLMIGALLDPPPAKKPKEVKRKSWRPKLGPIGYQILQTRSVLNRPEDVLVKLLYGERGSLKCVDRDTVIWTENGLSKIGSLSADKESNSIPISRNILSFDGRNYSVKYTDKFHNNPEKKGLELEFSSGHKLRCSTIHPLWTCYRGKFGWTKASDLTPEHHIPMLVGHPDWKTSISITVDHGSQYGKWKTSIDSELGYFLGMLVGDGSTTKGMAKFTTADAPIVDWMSNFSRTRFNANCRLEKGSEIDWCITGNCEINSLICALGMKKKSIHKRIPKEILESPKSVAIAFLQGLFDADGTSNKKTGLVSYTSACEELADDVQQLLLAIGIFSVKRISRTKLPDGRDYNAWFVHIMGENCHAFYKKVGFRLERKNRAHLLPRTTNPNRYQYPPCIVSDMKAAWDTRRSRGVEKTMKSFVWRNYWNNGYIPSRSRLAIFLKDIRAENLFKDYLIDHNVRWLAVASVTECVVDLCDIHVPDTHSFVAAGIPNHNTGVALNDLVLHCYDDVVKPEPGLRAMAPLAIICTIFRSAATEGGAWEKLHNLVLPEWFDGMGLQFTEPKQDDQKNRYCFIGNKVGGWSRVILKSIPYGDNIRARLKGIEPSYFFSDEITEQSGPDYFFVPFQQIRRPTRAPRIFMGACNPADTGEEHWVWKNMVMVPCNTVGNKDGPDIPTAKVNKREAIYGAMPNYGGGRLKGLDEQFHVYHVPVEENVHWTPEQIKAYQNTVLAEARFDKTAVDRLIKGLWTPRPTGEGLFKEFFVPNIHIKGDAIKGIGIMPKPGYPIIIGYDIGQVHNSISFLQRMPAQNGNIWVCFGEIFKYNKRITYKNLAKEVVAHMKHWNTKAACEFSFIHIGGEDAVNQWRPGSGSYDALIFEREFNEYQKELNPDSRLQIKLQGCPRGPGSISARVGILQGKLYDGNFLVSATCHNTRQMLMLLESDKKNASVPKETSKWTHVFDSITYPLFRYEINPSGVYVPTEVDAEPTLTACGVD